jgi:hypothetical protein
MEPGITWYDVLGVLPDAEARKIKRTYDAKASLLRPEMISGASSNVLKAVTRAQRILDKAWELLVVDQDPRPPATARRGDKLTVQVWHPAARPR